jgi:hypothetical protein
VPGDHPDGLEDDFALNPLIGCLWADADPGDESQRQDLEGQD